MAEFRPFPGLRQKNPDGTGYSEQDPDSFYILRQETGGGVRTAIIGALKAVKYSADGISQMDGASPKERSEASRKTKEAGFQSEPAVCISEPLGEEFLESVGGEEIPGTGLERIGDAEQIRKISEMLEGKRLIVTSGAAYYESAMATKSYVLAALMPSDGPGFSAEPVHRFVDTGSISEKNAVRGISKSFGLTETTAEDIGKGLADHLMGLMFRSGACYFADLPDREAPWSLGSYAAQEKIFKAVYKSDEGKGTVSYAESMDQAVRAMGEKKHDLAVLLNAPEMDILWETAGSGKRIPKRTAEFPPEIPSGLVCMKI